ncbi:aminotransferase [Tabrizicola sp. J26]|uniref:aminotransferase n=1 Tax=Alitabrizicola rongguiensis TaxID=2909234 RepID=UPI001F289222|nr:aminotransferase [Tabrizicola rongguiensis]MCF1709131.1 aminotransferase [Tabrizicola rongguiensis]
MKIREFGVEIWMNAHENDALYNLAETCVDSITVAELLALAGRNDAALSELLPMRMGYGAIEGSDRLKAAICALYDRQSPQNVIVTHGTIGANHLVHSALVGPGDVVVSIVPTYQQHYSIPESCGAEVRLVWLKPENGFLPDLAELEAAAKGAKLIALTNPNNPTGALIERAGLEAIAAIARANDAWVLCDEVYRGIDQQGDGFTPSMADLYEKGISTCGMSKAFSLAGLRLGWIAAPEEVIHAVSIHRDYTTISVGRLDDHFAAIALESADRILERSRRITRTNLAILDDWIAREPRIDYVRPRSGTTALLRCDLEMSSADLCRALQTETGVMLLPGSALDMEGWLRIGYACDTEVLRQGLALFSEFLARQ